MTGPASSSEAETRSRRNAPRQCGRSSGCHLPGPGDCGPEALARPDCLNLCLRSGLQLADVAHVLAVELERLAASGGDLELAGRSFGRFHGVPTSPPSLTRESGKSLVEGR